MYCGCMKKDNKTEQIDGADIQFEMLYQTVRHSS